MAATVEAAIFVEEDEVDQELPANEAHEAPRMPTGIGARSGGKDTYVSRRQRLFTGVAGHGRRKLFDDASPKRLSFPLGREEAQFFALLVGKGVAVADLIVVGRQLLEELSDPVTLADGVDVGHFVFGQGGEVQMHLVGPEAWWHPGVFFQSTTGVVVGLGMALGVARRGCKGRALAQQSVRRVQGRQFSAWRRQGRGRQGGVYTPLIR